MSWLGTAIKAVGGIFSSASPKTLEKGGELIDEAIHTDQEAIEEDAKDTASARADAQGAGFNGPFNAAVDAINRLQRPGWGLYFFGVCSKWWVPPDIQPNSYWAGMLTLYLTFLFGGRAILKDLPVALGLYKRMRNGT